MSSVNTRERRLLRGLEDDRVAGDQARRQALAGDRHRIVPGHQQRDDAARLVDHHVGGREGTRQRAPAVKRTQLGVLLDGADPGLHPATRVVERLAALTALKLGELLDVVAKPAGAVLEKLRTLGGHAARPGPLCVFALLRELGVPALAAALAGAPTLVFPWTDSVRLWATAGLNQIAVCLYLVAVTLGLRSLGASRARARALSRWALGLCIASMLTYPIAIVAVILTPLLYRLRASWGRAWRAGAPPAAAGGAALAYVSLATTKPSQPLEGQLRHAGTIAEEWLSLLAKAVLPIDGPPALAVLGAVAGGTAWGLVVAHRRAGRGETVSAGAVRAGVAMTWVGALAALAGYLVFVPGDAKYSPLAEGIYNRAGLLAAPAAAATALGVAILVSELALGRASRRGVAIATTLLAGTLLAGWSVRVRDDAARWDRAATRSREVLSVLDARLPTLAHGTTVYTVGHRRYEAPGVPVFSSSFDLDGAIKVRRGDASLAAYPLTGPLRCGVSSAAPAQPPYDRLERARYGRLYVLDVARRRALPIAGRADCQRARAGLGLGGGSG